MGVRLVQVHRTIPVHVEKYRRIEAYPRKYMDGLTFLFFLIEPIDTRDFVVRFYLVLFDSFFAIDESFFFPNRVRNEFFCQTISRSVNKTLSQINEWESLITGLILYKGGRERTE